MNRRSTGTIYEQSAARFLEEQGYRILEKNFRCRQGEIDLIALDGETVVFVEVKFRRDDRMGDGAEAVDRKKQKRIVGCARYYLFLHGEYASSPCRFDVVSVSGEEITLLRDAFWCSE